VGVVKYVYTFVLLWQKQHILATVRNNGCDLYLAKMNYHPKLNIAAIDDLSK